MICFAENADLPSAKIVPCLDVVGGSDSERYCDSVASAIVIMMVGIFGRL